MKTSQLKKKSEPSGVISDVSDGMLYKNLETIENSRFITLTLNTDGANVFKSNHKSLWPVQVVINELPTYKRFREQNVLVPLLWYGKGSPPMNVFLTPLIKQINETQTDLIHIDNLQFKLFVTVGSFDSPAKCKVQNMKQFNGYFGCGHCLHPGDVVNRTIKYKHRDHLQLRDPADSLGHISDSIKSKVAVFGHKGFSAMIKLSQFNIIDGYCVDVMHNGFLGIAKMFTSMILDPVNHAEEFYLGGKIKELEERLAAIKPPSSMPRNPRKLADRSVFKASEWESWALFYSYSVLFGILPSKYLRNWMLFTESIYLLLQDNISATDLEKAKSNLFDFEKRFAMLYGESKMTYNVHLLNHLCRSVEQCGPLWATSNFPFESGNGKLIKLVHGTTDVVKQISSKHLLKMLIGTAEEPNSKTERVWPHKILKDGLKQKFAEKFAQQLQNCQFYERITIKFKTYNTHSYKKSKKNNDSFVLLNDDSFGILESVLKLADGSIMIIVNKKYAMSSRQHYVHVKQLKRKKPEFVLIKAENLKEKLIFIQTENKIVYLKFPNKIKY